MFNTMQKTTWLTRSPSVVLPEYVSLLTPTTSCVNLEHSPRHDFKKPLGKKMRWLEEKLKQHTIRLYAMFIPEIHSFSKQNFFCLLSTSSILEPVSVACYGVNLGLRLRLCIRLILRIWTTYVTNDWRSIWQGRTDIGINLDNDSYVNDISPRCFVSYH